MASSVQRISKPAEKERQEHDEMVAARKQVILQMHDLIAKSMFKNMEDMKNDLNGICSQVSSKVSFNSKLGKKFEESQYREFKKSWEDYSAKYNSFLKEPNDFERFNDYHLALASLTDNFDKAINSYVEKRTEIWFRYVDTASNVLNAAAVAQVGVAIFSGGATLVTAGATKAAQFVMKKAGKQIGEKVVKKAMMKEIKAKVMENMAYKMMGSKTVMFGIFPAAMLYSTGVKPYASNEVLRQKMGDKALGEMPVLDAETRKKIISEYDRFGSTVTLEQLGTSIDNITSPKDISASEYLKSAAIVLGSYYIVMGIPQLGKFGKLMKEKIGRSKPPSIIESELVPGIVK